MFMCVRKCVYVCVCVCVTLCERLAWSWVGLVLHNETCRCGLVDYVWLVIVDVGVVARCGRCDGGARIGRGMSRV